MTTRLLVPASAQLPRQLHPGAWWLWALGLAAVASRTTNPLLLALVLAVLGHVVAARRTDAPWAGSFGVFLRLAAFVLAFRVVAQLIFGATQGELLLVTLPELALPDWAAGISLGGPVTWEMLVAALTDGMRLATILMCVGAANTLADPKRLLASLPAALYEVGVAVTVALSFAPAVVVSAQRIRAARRLRGRPDRGLRSILSVGMPVLEDALERSIALAAAMDSRGYGRRADVPTPVRRATAALTLTGLVGLSIGAYGLLDGESPAWLGLPAVVVGILAAAAGLRLAGRRAVRSRYRPDRFGAAERLTAATGVAALVATVVGSLVDPAALRPSIVPLVWPTLPLLPVLGCLTALLPAWFTPPPPVRLPARPGARASVPAPDPIPQEADT